MQQVNLNTEELKTFLTHIVNNNRFLQEQNKTSAAVEIIGESGIGKTSAALQLANELDLNFVKLNLAQIEELGDLIGFPIRQFQLCKENGKQAVNAVTPKTKVIQVEKEIEEPVEEEVLVTENKTVKKQVMVDGKFQMKEVTVPMKVKRKVTKMVKKTIMVDQEVEESQDYIPVNEECIWVDENAVEEYIKRDYKFTGEKRMAYCPPEWIADRQGGGILILDDWNRADIRFIQAVMELVDRQEYISWKLPKDWHILLTANPDNGEYLVQSIDNAQRTRFISVNLKFDENTWAKWAEKEGIDGRCINFLLMNPELVNDKINPRSVTTFFNAISSIENFSENLPLIQMIGEGSVGPEFTTMFTTFIHNKLDKLVSPKDILTHENEQYILGELNSCIGRGNDYRADIASVLTTRLINFTLKYSEGNTVTSKISDRLIKLSTDAECLTDDLKYILIKKVVNGNKQKFQKLLANPEVMKMAMK